MPKENILIKITCILLCIVLGVLLLVLAFKYLFSAVFPFFAAWLFVTALKKPSKFLSDKTKLSEKSASVVCTAVAIFVVGYLVYLFFSMLIHQITDIYTKLSSDKGVIDNLLGVVQGIGEKAEITIRKIPYIGERLVDNSERISFEENFTTRLSDIFLSLVPVIGNFIGTIIKAVPYFMVVLLVTVIASVYFSCDMENINRGISGIFPLKMRNVLFTVKNELFDVISGYFRAYSILFALTFCELFVGLNIIGVEYSFLVSALTAALDILPIFGIGAVLLPWAFVLFIFDSYKKAIGLVVLYIVMTVIRQSIEPKIVGGFLGLHPLLALFSMYVGIRLCGVIGLFLFPIIFIVTKNILLKRKHPFNE